MSFHVLSTLRAHENLVQYEWGRINSSERLMIILLIELNTCTCGGFCKRSFMLIVRTFSVDKLERIQSRGKTSETKSIHRFEDYASMGFASKMCALAPYIFRKWLVAAFVFISYASSKAREITRGMKDNLTWSQSTALHVARQYMYVGTVS